MSHSTISLGLGLGGGKSATSSGAPGGGASPYANEFSGNFDGTNDYLSVPKEICTTLASSAWSVSAWLYPETSASYDYVFSNGVPVQLVYHGGKIKAWLSSTSPGSNYFASGVTTTASVPTGAWTHVVAVFTTTSLKFYLDGSLDSTHTYSANSAANPDQAATIGSYITPSYFFDGLIDELSIFNTSLSGGSVTTIWNGGAPGDISALDPVAWWRMGESAGDVNGSGGAPANTDPIGTIVNAATGAASGGSGLDATQGTASYQPLFSTTVL